MSFFAADDLAVLWQLQCNVICFKAPPSPPKKNFTTFNKKTRDKIPCRSGRCFKMFQGKINFPVPVQSSLGGPGLYNLVRTDSLQTLGNPQTPAWVRFGGLQPEHLSKEEQNLQKPAVFGTDVHQVHGSIRIQAALAQPTDCVMRPSPNIPNAWNYHGINFFGPVVQLTPLLPCQERKSLGHQACSLARFPGATLNCKVQGSNHHL